MLRESIQTHRRIVWLFAGSHAIEELTHAEWPSYLIIARASSRAFGAIMGLNASRPKPPVGRTWCNCGRKPPNITQFQPVRIAARPDVFRFDPR